MRRAAVGLLVIMATLAPVVTVPPVAASTGSALLGVYYGNQGWNMTEVQALEAWQAKRDALLNLFTNWDTSSHTISNLFGQQLPAIWADHNVPMITWEPFTGANTPANIDDLILAGTYDGYIKTWAGKLRAFLAGPDGVYGTSDDRRAYLRFAHEANGNWYPWAPAGGSSSATTYVQMWQHVHALFDKAGLDTGHLQWVWAVNNTDVGGVTAEAVYPTGLVNWVAVDGYNWGVSQSWSAWQSPDQVFSNMIGRVEGLAPGLPVAITEAASSSDTTAGTDVSLKSQWIGAFYGYALSQGIGMICWFNEDKETDWAVFGGSNGDGTFKFGRTAYRTYSAYKAAVDQAALVPSDPSNARLLTDAQFATG